MNKFLSSDKLEEFLEKQGSQKRVLVPMEEEDTILFKPFVKNGKLRLGEIATASPKGVFLPQTETLLKFSQKKDPQDLKKVSVELEEPTDVQETLLFGVCPCDARGFEILDKVFLNKESYYTARREATTVVSLTCANPKSTCFCTSVGGSPASTGGADVLLTKVEGGYFAEPITEKGEALLNDPLLSDGSSKQAEAEKVKENALSKMKKVFDGDGIPEKILSLYENEDFWRDVSAKCLSCGLCTYLCPTCYCFNITDEAVGLNGERIRTWDSCMFFHYTLEGSGHNPRPTKLQRFRNRVGHKFCYYPQKYDGVFGCVGCGRCIRSCPVSMDIRQVITQAKEA